MSGQHSHGKKKGGSKHVANANSDETPLSKFPKAAQAPASSGAAGRPDPNTILKPSQVSSVAATPHTPRANGSSSSSSTPSAFLSPATTDKGIIKPLTPRGSPSGSGAGAAPGSTARPRHASPVKTSPGKPSPIKTAEKPAVGKSTTTAHSLSPATPPSAEAVISPTKKGKSPAKQAVLPATSAGAAAATDTSIKATLAEDTPPRRSSVEVCTTPDTGLASPPSPPTRSDIVQDPPASSTSAAPVQDPLLSTKVTPEPASFAEPAASSYIQDLVLPAPFPPYSQPLLASADPFLPAALPPKSEPQAAMQAPLAKMQGPPMAMLSPPASMHASPPERKSQGEAWQNDYQNASFETFNISEAGIGDRNNSNAFDEADEIMAAILGGRLSPPLGQAGPSSDAGPSSAGTSQPHSLVASSDPASDPLSVFPTSEQSDVFLASDLSDNVLGDRAGGSGSENFPIPAFVSETGALPSLLVAVSDATVAAVPDAVVDEATTAVLVALPAAAEDGVAVMEVNDGWLRCASGTLEPRHIALFSVLRALVRARTMGQHKEALGHFSRTVMWDVPPILMRDREQMRVAIYLAKFAAHMDFKAVIVGVSTSADGREMVEALLSFQLCPIMPWWMLPVRLVVPKRLDIQATVKIGTRSSISRSPDRIIWLWGRIHNLPAFPDLARVFNAFLMGRVAVWTEPLWCRVLWMVGDSSYGRNSHGKAGLVGAGKVQGHPAGN